MFITLVVLTALLAIATILPFSRCAHWMIRGWDFPRLQFAVFAITLLLLQLVYLDLTQLTTHGLMATSLFCLVVQLRWVLPYTRFWRKEVENASSNNSDNSICILSSNVLTPNRNAQALIDLVELHQPDILVTLESDQWWQDKLDVLEDTMPYSVKCPLDNLYGMHLYSKLPLAEQTINYLVEDNVPSIHTTITLRNNKQVRAHFLHPAPPSPTENTESSERDAELVIVAKSVAKSNLPIIVAGDFNDVAWSSTTRLFRKISGLLDPRLGRGIFNTFHVDYPLLRWPLDHLFHSQHFTCQEIKRLPSIGSDHFPLLAKLTFSPSDNCNEKDIDVESADHKRGKDISDEKNVREEDVPEPGE